MRQFIKRFLILCFSLFLITTTSKMSLAADEVPFRAVGEGKIEKDAKIEAYYTAVNRELAKLAGAQAEGDIGKKFHDDMSRDLDTFLKRYIMSDVQEKCVAIDSTGTTFDQLDPKNKKKVATLFRCQVQGTIKLLALQTDFRELMKSTERKLSNQLIFTVSSNDVSDPRGSYVVDKLTSAFLGAGFKVLSGSAVDDALAAKKIDFSLAIVDMQYSPANWDKDNKFWDPIEKRASGSLIVRFKLFDLKGNTQVASVPVTISDKMPGANVQDVADPLRDTLATAAAVEIGRQVSAAVVTFQASREKDQAATERAENGEKQYILRADGVTTRDRDKLKALREVIKTIVATATPEVDTSASNATSTTITFSTPGKLDTEDMLDALFSANKSEKNFNAKYAGNNEFVVSY